MHEQIKEKPIAEISKKHEGTNERNAYVEGVKDTVEAIRSYLSIASHLNDTFKISDLKQYLNRFDF